MKKALLLALAVVACAAWVSVPPKPKAPAFAVALTAAGTNVWAKWTIAATPSDSLTVDLSATGQASTHRMYVVDSKTDSISYPKPAPGGSITVSVLGKNWRVGKSAAAPIASRTYVEPDTVVTPPTVDVQITPTSATVVPGGTVQFTATIS